MVRGKTYSTEGIVLSRKNFGEADKILTIFTKFHGKLRVVARGVRRINSRKKSSLELFNHVRLFLVKGKNMDIVAEAEVKHNFTPWRKDLMRVGIAYHLSEVVNRLTPEQQEHREIFDLLIDAFSSLDQLDFWAIYPFVQSFKVRLLEELGFLERGKPVPKNLDIYIEDLINGNLKTKRFLATLR